MEGKRVRNWGDLSPKLGGSCARCWFQIWEIEAIDFACVALGGKMHAELRSVLSGKLSAQSIWKIRGGWDATTAAVCERLVVTSLMRAVADWPHSWPRL